MMTEAEWETLTRLMGQSPELTAFLWRCVQSNIPCGNENAVALGQTIRDRLSGDEWHIPDPIHEKDRTLVSRAADECQQLLLLVEQFLDWPLLSAVANDIVRLVRDDFPTHRAALLDSLLASTFDLAF